MPMIGSVLVAGVLIALAASLLLPAGRWARGLYFLSASAALAHVVFNQNAPALAGGAHWPLFAAFALLLFAFSPDVMRRLSGFPAFALLGALQAVCCIQLAPLVAGESIAIRLLATIIGCGLPLLAAVRLFAIDTLLPGALASLLLLYTGLAGADPICMHAAGWLCLVEPTAPTPWPEPTALALAVAVAGGTSLLSRDRVRHLAGEQATFDSAASEQGGSSIPSPKDHPHAEVRGAEPSPQSQTTPVTDRSRS